MTQKLYKTKTTVTDSGLFGMSWTPLILDVEVPCPVEKEFMGMFKDQKLHAINEFEGHFSNNIQLKLNTLGKINLRRGHSTVISSGIFLHLIQLC